VNAVAANPSGANIAAASKALGPVYFAQLVKYESQLKTLVQPYQCELNYLSANQAALTKLQDAQAKSPQQWQRWFWVDLVGMVVFIPLIWLTKGRWSPRKAKQDEQEHDRLVAEELSHLQHESAGAGASSP